MINGEDVNVQAVGDSGEESGVAHGSELLAFTEAVMNGDPDAIADTRDDLSSALGDQAVVDTSAVIAMFNIMDRIADATGIPIDDGIAHDVRHEIGDQLGMSHLDPDQRSAQ